MDRALQFENSISVPIQPGNLLSGPALSSQKAKPSPRFFSHILFPAALVIDFSMSLGSC